MKKNNRGTKTSKGDPIDSSSSESDNDDFGIFGDEPEKGEGSLALLLSSMKYEVIDETTKLELQNTARANSMAWDSIKINSSMLPKFNIIVTKLPTPKKRSRKPSKGEGSSSLDIRKFKKPKLGYGIDDCELSILPPVKRLAGIVGQCSRPFEKVLTRSDIAVVNYRLMLVKNYTIETILPLLDEDEKKKLANKISIEVPTFDKEGKEYAMLFKRWTDGKYYVLEGKGWNIFVEDHDLKASMDWVAVWSFRHRQSGKLCFAIVSRRMPVE